MTRSSVVVAVLEIFSSMCTRLRTQGTRSLARKGYFNALLWHKLARSMFMASGMVLFDGNREVEGGSEVFRHEHATKSHA